MIKQTDRLTIFYKSHVLCIELITQMIDVIQQEIQNKQTEIAKSRFRVRATKLTLIKLMKLCNKYHFAANCWTQLQIFKERKFRESCKKSFLQLLNKKSRELNVTKIRKAVQFGNWKSRTAGRKKIRLKMHLIKQKSCNSLPQIRKIPNM